MVKKHLNRAIESSAVERLKRFALPIAISVSSVAIAAAGVEISSQQKDSDSISERVAQTSPDVISSTASSLSGSFSREPKGCSISEGTWNLVTSGGELGSDINSEIQKQFPDQAKFMGSIDLTECAINLIDVLPQLNPGAKLETNENEGVDRLDRPVSGQTIILPNFKIN